MKAKVIIPFILLLGFAQFSVSVLAGGSTLAEDYRLDLYQAEVIEVEEETVIRDSIMQVLRIKILNRDYKGYETTIRNTVVENAYSIKLKKGDRITVHLQYDNSNEPSFYFKSYDKSSPLLILCLFFAVCVIILGRIKGIKALTSLTITILLVLFGLIPLLLKGYNPIILSVLTCMISSVVTFTICFGIGKKSIAAIVGVSGGLLVGGIIAYLFGILAKVSGFSHGDAQQLQYLPNGYMFDFKGLLFAGIIIGALGACTDVAISIASALTEIKSIDHQITKKELIASGFNIGKDIMGTMVNTLVLAYTGSSLSTIMLFMGLERGFSEIINLESISTEIVRAISGSIGLLFSIPITIFTFVILDGFNKKSKKA